MQKWGVVFVVLVLLSSVAFAVSTGVPSPNQDVDDITRITKFETDNVHILRIGNFSRAVVKEVAGLQENISVIQQQLAVIQEQLEELKKVKEIPAKIDDSGINQITSAVVAIESELEELKNKKQEPVELTLVLNGVILLSIFALFLLIRVQYGDNDKKKAEQHARLHLHNDVRKAIMAGVPVQKVRQNFVAEGWNSAWVDKAIEEGVKR